MAKKAGKHFLSKDLGDLPNESQYLKNSPKPKKVQTRRQQKSEVEETDNEDMAKFVKEYSAKKRKVERTDDHKEARQKLLDVMGRQLEARKETTNNLMSSLSEFLSQLEADHSVLAENDQKLQHMVAAMYKCVQQSTAAAKMKIRTLKEICVEFERECEGMDSEHKDENDKLANELEDQMTRLQQKLVNDTKKRQLESLRKSIFHAMQNDF